MQLCIYEDHAVDKLEPITLTRPLIQVRIGVSTILDKILTCFRPSSWGLWVRPYLVPLTQELYPDRPINHVSWLENDATILVNSRWLPPSRFDSIDEPHVGVCENQIAYIRLSRPLRFHQPHDWPDNLQGELADLPKRSVPGRFLCHPWDVIAINEDILIEEAHAWISCSASREIPKSVHVVGDNNLVSIDATASVEPPVVLNTHHGPIIIDKHAEVHAFSRLEGPCYIGCHSVILSGRIRRGTTIGPGCRIGGEVEASIFQGWSNKYHEGFLGHSWIGEWVNIAAGVQVSDLRHDYQSVPVRYHGQKQDSGLLKLGAIIGDHTKLGLGALVNTGSIFGAFCSILPGPSYVPGYIPSFCRCVRGELRVQEDLEACLDLARRVMRRRQNELSTTLADVYRYVYLRTAADRIHHASVVSKWTMRATA